MKRILLLLLVGGAVATLVAVLAPRAFADWAVNGTDPAPDRVRPAGRWVAQAGDVPGVGIEPALGEVPACSEGIEPSETADAGLVVITTEPRIAGVEVVIDGVSRTTDASGCLAVELAVGPHLIAPAPDEDGATTHVVDGKVRPLRAGWDPVVDLEPGLVELTLNVEPPVCALQPLRELPADLRAPDPSLLVISTVPRLPDVPVLIDGHEVRSDGEGCVVVELSRGDHELQVPDVSEIDATTRYIFGRWNDDWARQRSVTISPGTNELELGMKVQHPVAIDFLDAELNPVDRDRIETARIVNSFGEVFPLSEKATEEDDVISFDEVWLPANRLRRVAVGLYSDDNVYVFREVSLDGANVVQSGEVDYIPAQTLECPDLASAVAQRCNRWRVRLLLFPFEVELRSFIFREPVDGHVALHLLNEDAEPLVEGRSRDDGWLTWPQVPRGDYEIRVTVGGITTASPSIVTGPKVERITVMTSDFVLFLVPVLVLVVLTVIVGIIRPRWRLALAAIWPLVIGFVLSVPNLGAVVSRPLSAQASPAYTQTGAFAGITAEVHNSAPIPVEQSYCAPDFELRIPTDLGIWRATYESHDFHDVEMSRFCRLHRVDPGTTRNRFASTPGQEWVLEGELPPPGVYEAFVRVFDVPAGTFEIDLRNGLAPYLTFAEAADDDQTEVPFTNPFED